MTRTPSLLDSHDERLWPRWTGVFSAGVVLACLATLVVLLLGAPTTTKPWLVLAFVAFATVEVPIYLAAMRRVLDGHPVPVWSRLMQATLVVAGFVVSGPAWDLGGAMLAGLFGAMFAANLWSVRAVRSHSGWWVEEEAAEPAREGALV